ncbi:MAG TPA: glycosyltransferase family 4 protein, partial [Bacillota bacterium]
EQTICVSKDEYRKLKTAGIKSTNLNAIYNGVPDQEFSTDEAHRKLSLSPNLPVIGCVARLEQPKGIEYLIKACGILIERGIAVQLVLIGWGSEEYRLRKIASEYPNLPVVFTGALEETGPYYKLFNLYVQPSLVEPLGITAIEAMRAGLPVIASQVGGLAELVIDNETGVLIPPGNADAISEAIRKLLEDQALAQKMGQAGRKRFLNYFMVEQTTRKTVEVYEKALKYSDGITIFPG